MRGNQRLLLLTSLAGVSLLVFLSPVKATGRGFLRFLRKVLTVPNPDLNPPPDGVRQR